MIKNTLGKIYHPILHRMRNSPRLHFFTINKMVKKSLRKEERKPRLYVDVTNIHFKDTGTGIARVTKEIATRIVNYNQKYDVICIYNKHFDGYFDCNTNEFITFSKGDIYFGLDHGMYYCDKYEKLYRALLKNEIRVFFFLHDLIPVRHSTTCRKEIVKKFKIFINFVINYSGIICNSAATRDDLKLWLNENPHLRRNKHLLIAHSLLGCDFSVPHEVKTISNNDKISFLMVSTVEPRKKYDQAVKAFDILWQRGIDVQLTIVGRKGWKAEDTFSLIENNAEYNKRLFWYNTGISDEELAELYQKSTAVIMASITEGFGLAVAEAAQFKKPLIIRDIPPFREIAGENAFYFDGFEAQDLATAVEKWLLLYEKGAYPDSSKIKLRTWDDCTKDVYEILTKKIPGAKE